MVDWQVGDGVRRRKPHIDGDPSATGGTGAQTTPGQHTGACRTEQNLERRGILSGARISTCRSRKTDAFVNIIVSPQRAIAAAQRAIAGCDRAGIALQRPVGRATMAGSGQHPSSFTFWQQNGIWFPTLCRTWCDIQQIVARPAFPQDVRCSSQYPCLRDGLSP